MGSNYGLITIITPLRCYCCCVIRTCHLCVSCSVDPFPVWAIFRSNQWATTDPSETVVCAVLSVGKCIYNTLWCLSERVAYVVTVGFLQRNMSEWLYGLMSNSRWYANQCAFEVSLNKTNFTFSHSYDNARVCVWWYERRLQQHYTLVTTQEV